MVIGVISDTHGSLTAWRQAYENFLKNTDLIIHCGDLLYHGPRNPLPEGYDPKNLAREINSLQKPLLIVRGNCDADVDQLVLDYPLESPYVHVITPELKILAHHGHLWSEETVPLKVKQLYNIVISGHTHNPGIKKIDQLVFLNPGSPSLPKNNDQTPTIAFINETEIRIVNIQTGAVFQKFNVSNS
jgi:putative phosphoesterase